MHALQGLNTANAESAHKKESAVQNVLMSTADCCEPDGAVKGHPVQKAHSFRGPW